MKQKISDWVRGYLELCVPYDEATVIRTKHALENPTEENVLLALDFLSAFTAKHIQRISQETIGRDLSLDELVSVIASATAEKKWYTGLRNVVSETIKKETAEQVEIKEELQTEYTTKFERWEIDELAMEYIGRELDDEELDYYLTVLYEEVGEVFSDVSIEALFTVTGLKKYFVPYLPLDEKTKAIIANKSKRNGT